MKNGKQRKTPKKPISGGFFMFGFLGSNISRNGYACWESLLCTWFPACRLRGGSSPFRPGTPASAIYPVNVLLWNIRLDHILSRPHEGSSPVRSTICIQLILALEFPVTYIRYTSYTKYPANTRAQSIRFYNIGIRIIISSYCPVKSRISISKWV